MMKPYNFYLVDTKTPLYDGPVIKFGKTKSNVKTYIKKYDTFTDECKLIREWNIGHYKFTDTTEHLDKQVLAYADRTKIVNRISGDSLNSEYRIVDNDALLERYPGAKPERALGAFFDECVSMFVLKRHKIHIPLDPLQRANAAWFRLSKDDKKKFRPCYPMEVLDDRIMSMIFTNVGKSVGVFCPTITNIAGYNHDVFSGHTFYVLEGDPTVFVPPVLNNVKYYKEIRELMKDMKTSGHDILFINPPYNKTLYKDFIRIGMESKCDVCAFITPANPWLNRVKSAENIRYMTSYNMDIRTFLPDRVFPLAGISNPISMVVVDKRKSPEPKLFMNGVETDPHLVSNHPLYEMCLKYIPKHVSDSMADYYSDTTEQEDGYQYLSFCDRNGAGGAYGKPLFYKPFSRDYVIDSVGYVTGPTGNPDKGQWNVMKFTDAEIDHAVSWMHNPVAISLMHCRKVGNNVSSTDLALIPKIDLSAPPTDDHIKSELGMSDSDLRAIYQWYINVTDTNKLISDGLSVIHDPRDPQRPTGTNRTSTQDEFYTGRGMVDAGFDTIVKLNGWGVSDIFRCNVYDTAVGCGNIVVSILEKKLQTFVDCTGREPDPDETASIVSTFYGMDIESDVVEVTKRRISDLVFRYSKPLDIQRILDTHFVCCNSLEPWRTDYPDWALSIMSDDNLVNFGLRFPTRVETKYNTVMDEVYTHVTRLLTKSKGRYTVNRIDDINQNFVDKLVHACNNTAHDIVDTETTEENLCGVFGEF